MTGIRQDAFANANRIPVEQDKSAEDKGLYLHPEAFAPLPVKDVEWKHSPSAIEPPPQK